MSQAACVRAGLVDEGPPCERCGKPILDLRMGLVVWERWVAVHETVFDGLHFFHKGTCDPGSRTYMKSRELITVVEAGSSLSDYVALCLVAGAAEPRSSPDHWRSICETVSWLVRIREELVRKAGTAGEDPEPASAAQISSSGRRVRDQLRAARSERAA